MPARRWCAQALRPRGHATLIRAPWRCAPKIEVFGPESRACRADQACARSFDPRGVLNADALCGCVVMQTTFTLRSLPTGCRESEKILRACVHAAFAPRRADLCARRQRARFRRGASTSSGMLENAGATAEVVLHIDRCLSCSLHDDLSRRAYMHLVDHARVHIERRPPAAWRTRVATRSQLMPYPQRFRSGSVRRVCKNVRSVAERSGQAACRDLRLYAVRPASSARRADISRHKVRAKAVGFGWLRQRRAGPQLNAATISV